MSSQDIILNSLNYYDKKREKYNKILSKIKYVSFKKTDSDMKHNTIIFYDKNKKQLFQSRYELVGAYNNYSNTWIWAWSMPQISKNLQYTSRKILNYGLDIIDDYDNNNIFLKTELITSRFRISDPVQLDIHLSIAAYIAKIPIIFNLYYSPKRILEQFYEGFTKIKKPKKNDLFTKYSIFILDYGNISG